MTDKNQTFLLTIAILEGRHFAWLNMDSVVIVKVDGKSKCTTVKKNTDCPFYNEYFVFEFYSTLHEFVNKEITITVIQPRNIWRKRRTLGYISLDIATVWQQKNHQFYHKWAILSTPKTEISTGPKGYIKMDLSILSKGEVPKIPVHVINDEIEGNLLLPEGVFTERQRAKYVFNIYRCQYIMEKPINTVVDFNIEFDERPKSYGPTTFVEIIFARNSIRTSTKKHTSFPVFNEKLTIADLFPPLCQTIKIQLCHGDAIKKKVHSFKYINLKSICNEKDEGFLPTFGPNWMHLYTANKLEGYAGSIIVSMNTEIEEQQLTTDLKKKTMVESVVPLNEKKFFSSEGITIFSCIYEVTAINKKYSKEPVCIRMTFGRINVQKKVLPTGDDIVTNSTDPRKPKKMGKGYYYLGIKGEKPCLWITEVVPYFKKRVYNANILSRITVELKGMLDSIEALFSSFNAKKLSEEIESKLLDTIDFVSVTGRKYIDIVSSYSEDNLTKLDKERRKMCRQEMFNIIQNLENLYQKSSKKRTFRKLQKIYDIIEGLVEDVQDSWPDIFLWVVYGKKKVACCRIAAKDIIYSPILEERGQYCGVKRTLCFYANEKNHKNLTLKLDVSSFLYLDKHKYDLEIGFPSGYKFGEDTMKYPHVLVAEERYLFELRVHIFQGKIGYGFDKTGLADAFVRVIFNNEVKDTQVIFECLNPIWDETLLFERITVYGSRSHITTHIPTILVESFDRDEMSKNDFLGRTIIKPNVTVDGDKYQAPKLKWIQLYLNEEVTAEILAVFELIEVTEKKIVKPLESEKKRKFEIPIDIRPNLVPHKMEVMFWGVRNLKKINLITINRPRISVFIGDIKLDSDTMENAMRNPNFVTQVKGLNLILPTQLEYAPPLRFRLFDSRRFGVYVFAGVHITHISSFMVHPIRREERQRELSGVDYKSFDSMASQTDSSLKIPLRKKDEESDSDAESINERHEPRSYFFMRCLKKYLKLGKEKSRRRKSTVSIETYETVQQDEYLDEDDHDWWTKFHASLQPPSHDKSEILKLQIYGNELEKEPNFGGFTDMMESFELYKGKRIGDEAIDEDKITALLKCSVKIYEWPSDYANYVTENGHTLEEGFFNHFPENNPMRYLLRVYCVRGLGLRPKDLNGKSDPYLYLTLNDKFINDRENFIRRQVNPTFGKCFEFDATFPFDHSLKIAVWDYDTSTGDDLIGETKIDLETRNYTKHRAHCGIAENYKLSGYCAWREHTKPTTILSDLCRKWNTDRPEYSQTSVRIGFKEFSPDNFSSSGDPEYDKEVLALAALHHWTEMPIVGFTLVPEHVETRSLYNPAKPDIEQGKIQLWIDIFPIADLPPPKQVDITPRKPIKYELRVIVWNTEEVILDEDDFFTGERKSDIYVKCWLNDSSEAQYTDVHYRSLTGEGNFNWRFVFPFEYLPAEDKLVLYKKESVFSMEDTEFKMPCVLTMQVWDNDTFSKDDFLGSITLELSKLHRPARTVQKCNLSIIERGAPTINLFKIRRTRGWWPFRNIHPKTKKEICAGKVEAEMEILTEDKAVKEPAGLGRHEPQALPPPNRPDTSFLWFKNPFLAFKHIMCKLYRCRILKFTICILLVFLVVVGIYAFPGYTVKKFLGAR